MNGNSTQVYGHLTGLDIGVIAVYLSGSVVLGLLFARRGQADTEAYYVGGRTMPWWLVGFGLAATCFAADTPIWVGDMIYKRGIEGTWMHWATGIGFSFYVFVIAPLWRRSRILTDLEFLELRYSGRAATCLRLINSLYFSVVFNVMMMGVGILSISTVMQATTGLEKGWCVLITMGGALIYCAVSGMWGIAATDFMQFFVTFLGSAMLAGFAIHAVGGKAEMVEALRADTAWAGHELNVLPGTGSAMGLPLLTVLYVFLLRWWDNASIGQYVSQRLFCARSVRHATLGAMLHSLVYWSLVPLPWVITICAARIYFPDLTNGQEAYPRMAMAVLPSGLTGIIIASMLAAFMSTFSSLLSWGSSYAVNDFVRRFVLKDASPRTYVRLGQFCMLPMALGAALIAMAFDSIFNLLTYLFLVPAATFTVMLLRWLWWRVNAWAEVAALVSGIVLVLILTAAWLLGGRGLFQYEVRADTATPAQVTSARWMADRSADPAAAHAALNTALAAGERTLSVPVRGLYAFSLWMHPDHNEPFLGHKFLFIMGISLVVWVAVALRTAPTNPGHLDDFVRRVNPPGFWGAVRVRTGVRPVLTWPGIFQGWAIMLVAIYAPLVGLIKLFFGSTAQALLLLLIGAGAIALATRKALAMGDEWEPREERPGGA